jgi:hypothetical protein
VKVADLPKSILTTRQCCVAVSVDRAPAQRTKIVKGKDPQWNESFSMYASVYSQASCCNPPDSTIQEPSIVRIQVLQQGRLHADQLLGEVVVDDFTKAVEATGTSL